LFLQVPNRIIGGALDEVCLFQSPDAKVPVVNWIEDARSHSQYSLESCNWSSTPAVENDHRVDNKTDSGDVTYSTHMEDSVDMAKVMWNGKQN
jgi:hypothetical protein